MNVCFQHLLMKTRPFTGREGSERGVMAQNPARKNARKERLLKKRVQRGASQKSPLRKRDSINWRMQQTDLSLM